MPDLTPMYLIIANHNLNHWYHLNYWHRYNLIETDYLNNCYNLALELEIILWSCHYDSTLSIVNFKCFLSFYHFNLFILYSNHFNSFPYHFYFLFILLLLFFPPFFPHFHCYFIWNALKMSNIYRCSLFLFYKLISL